MDRYWFLHNINLYDILCPHRLKDYDMNTSISFQKEDIIYSEDQRDENIYMVSNGKVKIVNYNREGREVIKQILGRGELFGEKLILGETKRSEFAVACKNKTRVCAITLEEMKNLMRKNQKFETRIYKLIGIKLRRIERRLELLVGRDVKSRVCGFIYDQYVEQNSLKFVNYLTHYDIGKLLATTRAYVTKTFNELKQDGIIDYNRREIIIKDLPKLVVLSKD